jgi:DNA-binding GntR family transcriptional regulator
MDSQTRRAYNFIKDKISSTEYSSGYPLSTNKLQSEIGVSRTPIRDALRQLELEGLVTIVENARAHVRILDAKGYRELWQLRIALESYAAGLAAQNRTEEDLVLLEFHLEELRKVLHKYPNPIKFKQREINPRIQKNVNFHAAILRATHNELLQQEVARLQLMQNTLSRSAEMRSKNPSLNISASKTYEGHVRIFKAIKQQNVKKAREEVEAHIYTHAAVVKAMEDEEMGISSKS